MGIIWLDVPSELQGGMFSVPSQKNENEDTEFESQNESFS